MRGQMDPFENDNFGENDVSGENGRHGEQSPNF